MFAQRLSSAGKTSPKKNMASTVVFFDYGKDYIGHIGFEFAWGHVKRDGNIINSLGWGRRRVIGGRITSVKLLEGGGDEQVKIT